MKFLPISSLHRPAFSPPNSRKTSHTAFQLNTAMPAEGGSTPSWNPETVPSSDLAWSTATGRAGLFSNDMNFTTYILTNYQPWTIPIELPRLIGSLVPMIVGFTIMSSTVTRSQWKSATPRSSFVMADLTNTSQTRFQHQKGSTSLRIPHR